MRKTFVLSLLSCMFFVQIALGQATADTLSVNLKSIDVNARRNNLYSGIGRVLTVVDRKAIQQMPVQNIDELLESISGIDVRQRGVGGTQSDISIRGGSFDQVLVLLNGVNITDPQTGHYNLDIPVDLSDIVRVELLQGSAARVYGPNAFSGAINIVTEKNRKKSLSAQLSAGSFETFNQSVSSGIGNDKIQTFASVTHKSSKGYIDNTDYDIFNAFSQSVLRTDKAGKFDLQLAYQQKSYGANGFYSLKYPNQFDHTQTFFAALNWSYISENANLTAQTYARKHYDRFELFRDFEGALPFYTGHNYHLTDVAGAKAASTIQSGLGKITLGADVRNEHIYSTVLGETITQAVDNVFDNNNPFTKEDNRLLTTAFFDYSKNINSFYLSFGVAATFNNQFGTSGFGGFDIAYLPDEYIRLYFSANTAVRLPTFTDLYYQSATQIANPDLQPEKSKTLELGIKSDRKNLRLGGSAFYRIGNDIIDWGKNPDSTKWESKNLTNVNAFGVDAMAEYVFNEGFLKKTGFSYSYLSLDKEAVDFDSKYALDYMKHKAILSIQHNIWNKLSALWKFGYYDRAGDYTDFVTGQKVNYKPYLMADIRLSWTAKRYELYADANNLLNSTYADFGGLTQPGRNFMVGVRVKLE